jgi:hypothetical protein
MYYLYNMKTNKKILIMKTTIYSSKEEFERKNPYVLVAFEVMDDQTFSKIEKSFTNKKTAERYNEQFFHNKLEVMTRKKYNKEASMCL